MKTSFPIGTIVNFCTNESRFIAACLQEALLFSAQVIVPVASHFFDGTPENLQLLQTIYEAFPECLFIEYPFIPDQIPKSVFNRVRPAPFWHCLSRLIGVDHLDEAVEAVLFLDADEVADGKRIVSWLQTGEYRQYAALKLSNYWYFREPVYRAEKWEDSILLAQRKKLRADRLLDNEERDAVYRSLSGVKKREMVGRDGLPLFHHFSWVRTEEEMLRKVRSWSHREDRDWETLVHKEFTEGFQGKDFIHGYQFRTVEAPFEIPREIPDFIPRGQANVRRLQERDIKRYAKEKRGALWGWFNSP